MKKKRTYITLFSSAGVGCYGFKMNGFECIATNELLESRLNVQRANKKCKYESGYIGGDITTRAIHDKLFAEIEMWKEKEGLDQVDVVFATPPCQGMSTANYKKADDEQVRNSLVVQAIKLVSQIQPKIFVFENVRAFMKTICTDTDGADKPIADSIYHNLSDDYNIFYRVINFKDYGVPSSRPRTLVIGTSKQHPNLSPLALFPSRHKEIKLREAIGDLAPLGYCEKDKTDYLHFARYFAEEQLVWIKHLKEGQSAFNQPEEYQPSHIDKDGNRVVNKGAYMGNKYRRLVWDKVCSCIHTRNDVLSSQDTIHPTDHRVLSIRELMRVMTIPNEFHWTTYDDTTTIENAEEYLKANELNIRRCIGEAVPTQIGKNIAAKAMLALNGEAMSQAEFFNQCKDIDITSSNAKVLVTDNHSLRSYLPQIAGLFCHKDSIEIYCVDCSAEKKRLLKKTLKDWDLMDTIILTFIASTESGNHNYDLTLSDGMLKPYHKVTEIYQPSLFD